MFFKKRTPAIRYWGYEINLDWTMGVRIWMKKCDTTASYRGSAVSIQAGIWRGRSLSRSA